ncbi:MAG: molecular chaperone HtpG [Flavobacteriales bacterium]|nr:molecular chaperone HtpG [Flavobacteriales bacterium]|tara:strand:- start:3296 stop:5179 length:1884 start_codon:yes stop_codon:yes gene_type:complete
MAKGKIKVTSENIFPIIKKFLYSDQEIFLRELVSNAVDASNKLKKLSSIGEYKGEVGELLVEVKLDKKARTISISDNGIGMTEDEVKNYINQVAFSGAEEFVKKYDDKTNSTGIIGHFGLGFYSAFMVAEEVEIFSKSYKDSPAINWKCDGSPNFSLKNIEKNERGTDVVLHISKDSDSFLDDKKLSDLLNKYCKFLPVKIKFGTKELTEKEGEGKNEKEIKKTVDNIINNTNPAWTKKPSGLKDEDYKSFHRELYPMNFEDPLFHIHLNVDFPFNLTGILYFPRLKQNIDLNKNKIQLYCNQVFVTDSVEGIVPEFLAMLQGVIDSPDIPLNVSRSYLQSDSNVKKISGHISKKVSDKLSDMFKSDRKSFEDKWEDMKVIIEYGMLTDPKFFERSQKYALYKNVNDEFFILDDYLKKINVNQKDKDGKTVILYTNDRENQHSFIQEAKNKSYDILVLDSPIVSHLIQKLESDKKDISFARVDADSIDKLIKKDEVVPSVISEKDEKSLKKSLEKILNKDKYTVQFESLSPDSSPFSITRSEFMRRMQEMNATGGGGMFGMGNMPEMYNMVVNGNHPLISKIISQKSSKKKSEMLKHATDLAKLSQGLLKGENLTMFIKENYQKLEK